MPYPELEKLKDLQSKHSLVITKTDENIHGLLPVRLEVGEYACHLLVEDEFEDFDDAKPLLSLFLVLSTLETYKEGQDYLSWCNFNGINAQETDLLEYYKSLAEVYRELEQRIGKIEAYISPFDYQLRAGAYQELVSLGL